MNSVRFNELVEVRLICVCHACKTSRSGKIWLENARDRFRFKKLIIEKFACILLPVLLNKLNKMKIE